MKTLKQQLQEKIKAGFGLGWIQVYLRKSPTEKGEASFWLTKDVQSFLEEKAPEMIIDVVAEFLKQKRQLNNDKYAANISDYNLGKIEEDKELLEELKP